VPQARGQASQITNAASAYHDQIIAVAKGQADAFNSVYQSYKNAPAVTRERMYLEAMEQILTGKDKIIIEPSAAGTGVHPLPAAGFAEAGTPPPVATQAPGAAPNLSPSTTATGTR